MANDDSQYKAERYRLETFLTWPKADIVSPEILAKDGFIYLKLGDRVKCIFCNGVLRTWEPDNNPVEEHERHFPHCPFVLGYDVGNIPIGLDSRRNPSLGAYNAHVSSSQTVIADNSGGNLNNERLKAANPRFAVRSTRVESFTNWPSHQQLIPELAEAGFYYTGDDDSVKCFCCDICLTGWSANDKAWYAHAKNFPQCDYLKIAKEEFVNDVLTKTSLESYTSGPKPVVYYKVDPREVRARLDTPSVRSLLSMGYSVAELTTAIEQQLRKTGNDFQTLSEFVAILDKNRTRTVPNITVAASGDSSASSVSLMSTSSASSTLAIGKNKDTKPEEFILEDYADDEEVRNVLEENKRLKEARQCKVCMDEEISVVILPCGHASTCTGCAATLSHCPICRNYIRGTVKIIAL